MNTHPHMAAGRSRFWEQLLAFGRWIAERDELPRDEEEAPAGPTGSPPFTWLTAADPLPSCTEYSFRHRGFFRWLVSRDSLPSRVGSPRDQRGVRRWLASPDQLPRLEEGQHRHQGFFAWLAAGQQLPSRPPTDDSAPRSFLRWLLTSEDHHRLNRVDSTKEVAPHES